MRKDACIRAIDLLLNDEWDAAHHIVQDLSDSHAQWIHAVVHKIEGDTGNSRYWYNRSGLEVFESFNDPKEELQLIRNKLTD
jgi:hypothetical protein